MIRRNLKPIFWVISLFVLLTAEECGCRNFKYNVARADYDLSVKMHKDTLFLDDGDYTEVTLDINAKTEVAEICDFYITEWSVNNDVQGELRSDDAKTTIDIKELKFKKGQTKLTYKPTKTGQHTLTFTVVDQWQDLTKETKSNTITVKQKKDFACSGGSSTAFRKSGSDRYYPIDLKIGSMDKELKGSAFKISGCKYSDGSDVELLDEHFNPIIDWKVDANTGKKLYIKAPTDPSVVPPTITATISCDDKITKYVSIYLDEVYKQEREEKNKKEKNKWQSDINDIKSGGEGFKGCQDLSKDIEDKLADLERQKAEINAYPFASDKDKADLLANVKKQIDDLKALQKQLDKKKAEAEKAYHDFEVALAADRKEIFIHQTSDVTIDITSDQEGAKAISYTITQLEIDKGHLCDGAGNLVEVGSELPYGSNNLTFNPTEVGKTRISITVNNGKESEHTTKAIYLKIHPVAFDIKASAREATGEEIKRLKEAYTQNEIFATIDLSLDKLADGLKAEAWKISEYNFSDDMQGILLNKDLEHHAEFALDPKAKNTLFVTLPRLDLTQETHCTITVEGPDGTTKDVTVSLKKIKKSIIAKRIADVKKANEVLIKEMDNLAGQTESGEGYNQVKELLQQVYQQEDILEEMQSDDLRQELRSDYDQLNKVGERLEAAKAKLNTFQTNCEKKKIAFKASLKATENEIFSHQSAHLTLDFLPFDSQEDEVKKLIYEVTELDCPNGILAFQENKNQVQVGDILPFGSHALIFKPTQPGQANIKLKLRSSKGATAMPQATINVKKIDCTVDATPKVATESEKENIDGNVGVIDINLTGIASALQREDWKIASYEFDIENQDTASAEPASDSLGLEASRERHIKEAILRLDNELAHAKKQLQESEEEANKTKAALEKVQKELAEKEAKWTADKVREEALEAALIDNREKAAAAEKAFKEAEEKHRTVEGEFRSAEAMYEAVKARLEELQGGGFGEYDKAEKGLAEAKAKFESVEAERDVLIEEEKDKKKELEGFEGEVVERVKQLLLNNIGRIQITDEYKIKQAASLYPSHTSRTDKEFVLAAVEKNGLALQFAEDDLRRDLDIVLTAVKQDGRAWMYASEELKNDRKVMLAVVKKNGLDLEDAIDTLKCTRNEQNEAKYLWAQRYVQYLLENLELVSQDLRNNKEFVLEAVQNCGTSLYFASENLRQDRDVVMTAVKQSGEALPYTSEALRQDRDVVMAAVKQNGMALEHTSKAFKNDREVVSAAVKQDGRAVQFASFSIQIDDEFMREAVKQNGMALFREKRELREDINVALDAVRSNGIALLCVSEELRKDRLVVFEAVKNFGAALEFAGDELNEDRMLVLEAVKNFGEALKFAHESLQQDREIVLAAAAQNIDALQYASDDLKNDKAFVMQAVRQHINALGIVRQNLKEDRDVIVEKIAELVGLPSHFKKLLELDTALAYCTYALKRKKIELNNARKALAKAQEYAYKSPFFVKYKEAQAKKEAAEKVFAEDKEAHEHLQAAAKASEKELEKASLKRRKAELEKEQVAAASIDAARKLANAEETAKQLATHVEKQEKETNSEKADLDQKLKTLQRLRASRGTLQSSEPTLLTQEKEQLSRIPLSGAAKNTLYVNLPTLRLSDNPTLNLKVQGPGETTVEKKVKLPN